MTEMRKAEKKDCKELAVLKKQIWSTAYAGIYPDEKIKGFDFEANEKKFEKMLEEHAQELYVLCDEEKTVGYFSFGKILRPFKNYKYDIGLLYLLPEYQGKGIGTSIISFCKEKFFEMGIEEFIVSCNKYNLSAQKFYLKNGGKIIHTDADEEDRSVPQVKFLFKYKA